MIVCQMILSDTLRFGETRNSESNSKREVA